MNVQALLNHLASRPADVAGIADRFGLPTPRVRAILAQLAREGLVMLVGDGRWDLTRVARRGDGLDLDRDLRKFPERPSLVARR